MPQQRDARIRLARSLQPLSFSLEADCLDVRVRTWRGLERGLRFEHVRVRRVELVLEPVAVRADAIRQRELVMRARAPRHEVTGLEVAVREVSEQRGYERRVIAESPDDDTLRHRDPPGG